MAVDMFLKLKDVKGEAQDKDHKDEIDVLAYSWSVSQSGTTHMGGGGGSGKGNFGDLSVTKYIDKASADLLQACATGKHLAEGTFVARKAGDKPLEYVKLKMEDIIVTSVSMGGSGGEDRQTENVTLNFAKFEYNYVEQTAQGSAGAKPRFGWDIAANVPK